MTIARLEITDPMDTTVKWWSEAHGLKSVTRIDFRQGLNVLFAPNGYGKSTILEVIADLTHCKQGGIPAFTDDSLRLFSVLFADTQVGRGAKLVSDGGLCFYADPSKKPGLIGGPFYMDGVLSALAHMSSGEWCTWAINRIVGLSRDVKGFEDRTTSRLGLEGLKALPRYATWLSTQEIVDLGPKQRTILLDEFDRSLDIPMAAQTWALLAKFAAKQVQLIVAAHSPIVLKLADQGLCNLIDLCPGYVGACRKSLRYFEDDIEAASIPPAFQWKPPLDLKPPQPKSKPQANHRGRKPLADRE